MVIKQYAENQTFKSVSGHSRVIATEQCFDTHALLCLACKLFSLEAAFFKDSSTFHIHICCCCLPQKCFEVAPLFFYFLVNFYYYYVQNY